MSKGKRYAAIIGFIATPLFATPRYLETGLHQQLGLEGYHHTYKETVDNRFFMNLKGPLFGIYYNVTFQPETTLFRFALETYAARGSTHYNSDGTGSLENDLLGVFEGRLLGSYTLILQNKWMMENYIGIGTRYLVNPKNRHLTTTGHDSYHRESHYYYIPIGIRIIKPLDNEVQFIGYMEYDWWLSGLQKSHLAIVEKNKQPYGYGARIGVEVYLPSSTYCLDYTMGVFARYWDIQDSKISSNGLYEPKNKTQELGLRLGIAF